MAQSFEVITHNVTFPHFISMSCKTWSGKLQNGQGHVALLVSQSRAFRTLHSAFYFPHSAFFSRTQGMGCGLGYLTSVHRVQQQHAENSIQSLDDSYLQHKQHIQNTPFKKLITLNNLTFEFGDFNFPLKLTFTCFYFNTSASFIVTRDGRFG